MDKLLQLIAHKTEHTQWIPLGDLATIRNGKSYKKLPEGDIPVYGTGGIMTYVGDYAHPGPSVLIPRKGSLDKLYFVEGPFWTVDTIFYTEIGALLEPKYLFYYLQFLHLENLNQAAGIPSLTQTALKKIRIPVPQIPTQQAIVEVLDKFTELEARTLQYSFYRNFVISGSRTWNFDPTSSPKPWNWEPLQKVAEPVRSSGKIPKSKYTQTGDYPIIDQGQNYISGYSDRADLLTGPGEFVLFGDHTREIKYINGSFIQGADGLKILSAGEKVLPRYLYFALKTLPIPNLGYSRHWSTVNNLQIPVPPREEQERIVEILDRFDALVNDISIGLPAEIEARRKQYEYYRDKLLTFEEATDE